MIRRIWTGLRRLAASSAFIHWMKWLVCGLSVLLAWWLQGLGLNPVQRLENAVLDLRYRARPAVEQKDIVLVGVADSSLNLVELSEDELEQEPLLRELQKPFPWKREVWAVLLDRLMEAGARMVVFDFFFGNPMTGDELFAEAIERNADRVVIGSYFFSDTSGTGGTTQVRYQDPTDELIPLEGDEVVGYTNVYPDRDGVVRRMRHSTHLLAELSGVIQGTGDAGVPAWMADEPPLLSLTGLAMLKLEGKTPEDAPLDWLEHRLVNFSGPRNWFPTFAVEDFFLPGSRTQHLEQSGYFQDKIVVIGPLAIIFQDMKATPLDVLVPGPEIHAHLMADLLDGRRMREAGINWQMGVGLALAVLVTVGGVSIQSAMRKQLWMLFLLVAAGLASQWAFESRLLAFPVFVPLFCLLVPGMFALLYDFIQEQYERRRLRGVLDRYVSPNVASVIIQQDRDSFTTALRGQKRPISVLFSDIRGFTSWSEKLDPIILVEQLNEYFAGTVQAVLDQEGTLQKYIGDALMAVWGDTHTQGEAEDAERAVRAALRMVAALNALNQKWGLEERRSCLNTGIGLNQGEAVVGNLGHPQRMEFTVLGDAVNFAARMESATKQFQQTILLSQSVRDLAGDGFIFRRIDRLRVKGKTLPVEVFTVLGEKNEMQEPVWLSPYHEAIERFRARQFAEAQAQFNELANSTLKGDFMCQHYLRRCSESLLKMPPSDWDASYELVEK